MSKKNQNTKQKGGAKEPVTPEVAHPKKAWLLPILPLLFIVTWAWSALYYGDVFHMTRANSFFVFDQSQMQFILEQSYGSIRYLGRMLLMPFYHPWIGGLLIALMATLSAWSISVLLNLSSKWRWISLLPTATFMLVISYAGLNVYFERETGFVLGIPATITALLLIAALIRCAVARKAYGRIFLIPENENAMGNRLQVLVLLLGVGLSIAYVEIHSPYVRVINALIRQSTEQDWQAMQKTARANATQSNRPMAAFYAISLVQTGQIVDRLYDIRLDYDSLDISGWDRQHNNANGLYLCDASYHGGFIQTAYHNCMERMVMDGPTIHTMQIMIKCALMRHEWELAKKYLRILRQVPMESNFCEKYEAMVGNAERVNADPEMAVIRQTEPLHDSFESMYQQPVFMGYNLNLYEGRSINALYNSLAVCLYTKLMPDFMARLEPLAGQTPPENIQDGILLIANKNPNLPKMFSNMDLRASRLNSYLKDVNPYMKDRPGHARELFDRYKGYYPYYYFFGNLKATKKREVTTSSSSGVN